MEFFKYLHKKNLHSAGSAALRIQEHQVSLSPVPRPNIAVKFLIQFLTSTWTCRNPLFCGRRTTCS